MKIYRVIIRLLHALILLLQVSDLFVHRSHIEPLHQVHIAELLLLFYQLFHLQLVDLLLYLVLLFVLHMRLLLEELLSEKFLLVKFIVFD